MSSLFIKYGVMAQVKKLLDDIVQDNSTLIINAVYSTTVEQDNDTLKIV